MENFNVSYKFLTEFHFISLRSWQVNYRITDKLKIIGANNSESMRYWKMSALENCEWIISTCAICVPIDSVKLKKISKQH